MLGVLGFRAHAGRALFVFVRLLRQLAPISHPLSVRESVANSNLFATLSLTLKG